MMFRMFISVRVSFDSVSVGLHHSPPPVRPLRFLRATRPCPEEGSAKKCRRSRLSRWRTSKGKIIRLYYWSRVR